MTNGTKDDINARLSGDGPPGHSGAYTVGLVGFGVIIGILLVFLSLFFMGGMP